MRICGNGTGVVQWFLVGFICIYVKLVYYRGPCASLYVYPGVEIYSTFYFVTLYLSLRVYTISPQKARVSQQHAPKKCSIQTNYPWCKKKYLQVGLVIWRDASQSSTQRLISTAVDEVKSGWEGSVVHVVKIADAPTEDDTFLNQMELCAIVRRSDPTLLSPQLYQLHIVAKRRHVWQAWVLAETRVSEMPRTRNC